MSEATLIGTDFKALVEALSRYPTLGSFVGSDQINLQIKDGKLLGSAFGIVVSRVAVPATGETRLFAMQQDPLSSFAKICNKAEVRLTEVEGGVVLRTRGRKVMAPYAQGQLHKIGSVDVQPFKLTKPAARMIAYLSDIAMHDTTRPELCAVMLDEGRAVAMSSKVAAALTCGVKTSGRVAMPLPLAKVCQEGDQIHPGEKETIVSSGIGRYMMPSPTDAKKRFPMAVLAKFEGLKKTPIAVCDGTKLASAFEECAAVLGSVSRTEVIGHISIKGGKFLLTSKNGGVVFERVFAVDQKQEQELTLPVDEALRASPLFSSHPVTISKGANGETFMAFESGYILFPDWKAAK